eukprot:13341-Heterococcus_DN1.PRE.1
MKGAHTKGAPSWQDVLDRSEASAQPQAAAAVHTHPEEQSWSSRMALEPSQDYTATARARAAQVHARQQDPSSWKSKVCMPYAYGQLLIATVLMICIAYAWAKRDHSTDPAENHNGRICPPVTCNMQWLLVFLDALYLMFAGAFTRKFGQYPSARFFNKGRLISGAILTHIVAGSTVISYGGIMWIKYPTSDLTILNMLMGIMGLVHSASVIIMLPIVIGERRITIPLYAWAGGVNAYNSLRLLQHPGDIQNVITLWCTMNVFVLVRFQLAGEALTYYCTALVLTGASLCMMLQDLP